MVFLKTKNKKQENQNGYLCLTKNGKKFPAKDPVKDMIPHGLVPLFSLTSSCLVDNSVLENEIYLCLVPPLHRSHRFHSLGRGKHRKQAAIQAVA